MKNNKCEIAIFLEHHDDKGGAETISFLLKPLKAKEYTSYLFEEPSDQSYTETSIALKHAKNYYLSDLLNYLRPMVESKDYVGLTNKDLATLLAKSKNIVNLKEIGYWTVNTFPDK